MASLFVPCASICRQTKHSACKSQFAVTSCQEWETWNVHLYILSTHTHTVNSFRFNPHRHNFSQSSFLSSFYVLYTSSKNIFSHTLGGLLLPCTYHQRVCLYAMREKKGNFNSSLYDDKNFHIRPALLYSIPICGSILR
jgi:hypothetical protein